MTVANRTTYTDAQVEAWLQGLLAIAWSDGDFDPQEQELIAELTMGELANGKNYCSLELITPVQVAQTLGPELADNFMRTAVMVAIADGVYTHSESQLLHQFADALRISPEVLQSLEHTMYAQTDVETEKNSDLDVLSPVKHWLDDWDVQDAKVAKFVCKLIPPQCPFERDVVLFGRKIVHIPPLCKLNPLYEQLVGLRFRALSYLADECHEDISEYC
jgi:tellurite resistance protein